MTSFQCTRATIRALERAAIRSTPRSLTSLHPISRVVSTSRQSCKFSPSSHRSFSIVPRLQKEEAPNPSGLPPPKSYNYQGVVDLTTDPSPNRILIDVREPSELLQTGRIPTSKSVPISSAPDAFFMTEEDFESKFGFPRPGEGDEVIFYCKAGVRSRQAALLAGQARPTFGGKIGNYPGSWVDWEKNGGKIEREGGQ